MTIEQINILKRTLNGFKLQELCDIAIHEFPECTWKELQNRLILDKRAITKKNIIEVIGKIVGENELDNSEIKERITVLTLLAIANSHTKTWWTYLLKDDIKQPSSNEHFKRIVKNALLDCDVLSDVHCIKSSGQSVISVTKKIIIKRTGRIRKLGTIYFKMFLGFPYVFSSRASVQKEIVSAVCKGLGYSRCDPYNLCGKNVKELLKILRNREGKVHSGQALLEAPQLLHTYRETPNGVSFNQETNRATYADKVFGSTPPQIEKFAVSIKKATWTQIGDFDQMNGTALADVTITFRSNNAIETIKELIKRNLVVLPLPEYMQAVLSGKNILKVRQAT